MYDMTWLTGAYGGAKVTRYVDQELLKKLFTVTMLVLGGRTLWRAW